MFLTDSWRSTKALRVSASDHVRRERLADARGDVDHGQDCHRANAAEIRVSSVVPSVAKTQEHVLQFALVEILQEDPGGRQLISS